MQNANEAMAGDKPGNGTGALAQERAPDIVEAMNAHEPDKALKNTTAREMLVISSVFS